MSKIPKTILFRLMLVISILVFTYLAITSTPAEIKTIPMSDKLNHFAAFFVLSWLCVRSFPHQKMMKQVLFLLSYGLFIEIIQYPLPYRSSSVGDLVADVAGISFYFFVSKYIFKKPQ